MKRVLLLILIFNIGLLNYSISNAVHPNIKGVWEFKKYVSGSKTKKLKNQNKLKERGQGYIFQEDNKVIIRRNTSFCGTPPITYYNYDGTWIWLSDSTFAIEYQLPAYLPTKNVVEKIKVIKSNKKQLILNFYETNITYLDSTLNQ